MENRKLRSFCRSDNHYGVKVWVSLGSTTITTISSFSALHFAKVIFAVSILFYCVSGLEGAVFSLLDRESDRKIQADAKDLLSHIVQAVALDNLGFWVQICKSVLAASTGRMFKSFKIA